MILWIHYLHAFSQMKCIMINITDQTHRIK